MTPTGDGERASRRRLFAAGADEPRARRATDVILLALAAITLVFTALIADPPPGVVEALTRLVASLPPFLDAIWSVIADLYVMVGVALVAAAAIMRRASVVRDLVIAVLLAAALGSVTMRLVDGAWPAWADLRSADPLTAFPSLRLALPAAIFITASPHLTRPARRLGRRLTAAAAFAVVAIGAATPLSAAAGILVACIGAAAVHLFFKSSGGRPSLRAVEGALAELGVGVEALGAADRQEAGLFLLNGTADDGDRLVVKVYGRDAHDAALVSTVWRNAWYREPGSPLRIGRLQQVEHEAFVTLLAGQLGIATDSVVTAGTTVDDDALLVLRRSGQLLADSDAPETDLSGIWQALQRLHRRGIAHRQVDQRCLLVDRTGVVGLVDFRGAVVGATGALLHVDQAQALATTAAMLGAARAVELAHEQLGAQQLTTMLPYLQPATLTSWQRRQLEDGRFNLDELRDAASATLGMETPALQQLRRITVGALLRVLLPAAALLALLPVLGGLDVRQLIDALGGATWWLIVLGILVAQLPRFSQAISTLGAAPAPLPLGPVYALQLAVSYINLAVPTSAARIAINIRFFQRHGVPPGGALAAGALDGFGGFVVQLLLLGGLLLFTPLSVDLDFADAADSANRILLVVVGIVVLAVAALVLVGRLRRFVIGLARRIGAEAREALGGLRSPRRLGLLLGGNLATEILFALALGTFTYALGYSVGIGELVFINISVSLLAGLLPVPGGIGVVEGGLTYGLVRAGVPEEQAFGAVILFRLASFYLPPVWGYFAMRWLERNDHL